MAMRQACRLSVFSCARPFSKDLLLTCRRRFSGGGGSLLLQVEEYGAKGATTIAPLVFIHGVLGSSSNFRSFARHEDITLKERRRVITLSLRNHGDSPHSDEPMTLEACAEDVAYTLSTLGISSGADVIGHSLGGKVSMLLALRYPDVVRRNMVSDMAPVSYLNANWEERMRFVKALQDIDLGSLSSRAEADKLLQPTVESPGIRAFLLQNLASNPNGEGYMWRANLDCIHKSLSLLGDFNVPDDSLVSEHKTLFVYGTASNYVQPSNPEHMDAIRKWFPRAEVHGVEGAGHWLHAERPAEFRTLVGEFFAE